MAKTTQHIPTEPQAEVVTNTADVTAEVLSYEGYTLDLREGTEFRKVFENYKQCTPEEASKTNALIRTALNIPESVPIEIFHNPESGSALADQWQRPIVEERSHITQVTGKAVILDTAFPIKIRMPKGEKTEIFIENGEADLCQLEKLKYVLEDASDELLSDLNSELTQEPPAGSIESLEKEFDIDLSISRALNIDMDPDRLYALYTRGFSKEGKMLAVFSLNDRSTQSTNFRAFFIEPDGQTSELQGVKIDQSSRIRDGGSLVFNTDEGFSFTSWVETSSKANLITFNRTT